MVLELEATVICVDDSEWMRNGDYPPTRLQAQEDAANLVVGTKMTSNPENTVGVLAMAGDRVRVLLAPTSDPVKFLACMHGLEASGEANLTATLNIAELVLKNRPDKRLSQRIVVFVGSPVKDEKLETIGKKLKKYNVSLDVVEFGESDDEKPEKLEALVAAVGGSSHIVHIPPGEDLRAVLANTPIITGDEGGGAAAGGASRYEYNVDPNVDPEFAEALRLSEIARQEAAADGASRYEYSVDPNADPELAETFRLAAGEPSTSNTDTVLLESDSDTYVPFHEFIQNNPFVTGAESASDRPADDERATEEGFRMIREALARSANAAHAEISGNSSSGQELELDMLARVAAMQIQEQEEEEEGDEQDEADDDVSCPSTRTRKLGHPRSRAEDARAALVGDRSRGGGGAAPGRLRWLRCAEARGAMEAADARMAGGGGGATRGRAGLVEARGAGRGGRVARGLALVHRLVANGDPRSTPWSRRARSSPLMSPSCSPSSLTASSTWSTAKQIDDLLAFYGWCDDVGLAR
ncbi:Os10g0141400 [Oryza sativa Japonica Group]|uniref:26S proteasome non-ATPase regulatory subunit 4 homolog n=1 Tax=Oryza sativa subsp. japonica TaxID=39947 RepID=Q0IZ08_ORYSJ|nr:Os10g0141400 [Oryza sativa Japonica Group]|eukprot:NP_001064143.2 Os10g0141400 [Oryza sativa Japonica Group]